MNTIISTGTAEGTLNMNISTGRRKKKKFFMHTTDGVQLLIQADGALNTNVIQAGAKIIFFIHTVD